MKILAIGDFHGKFPEKLKKAAQEADLILSNGDYAGIDEWRPLLRKMFKSKEKGVDITIEKILGKKKYKKLLIKDFKEGEVPIKELNKLKIRVFSVFGNGDWYKVYFNDYGKNYEEVIKKLKYIKNINRAYSKFNGLKILGFGGYIDSDVYFTRKSMKAFNSSLNDTKRRKKRYEKLSKRFMKLMKYNPDILLVHYPPYKCQDKMNAKWAALHGENMGIKFLNRGIKKYHPFLVICGHMHENQGSCRLGKSWVVNAGAASEGRAALIEVDEKKKKVLRIKFLK